MKKRFVLASMLVILLVSCLMFIVDYKLAVQQKTPFFAIKTVVYKDGGTTEYIGPGYKVIDYNRLPEKESKTDVVFLSLFINHGEKE